MTQYLMSAEGADFLMGCFAALSVLATLSTFFISERAEVRLSKR